MPIATCRFVEVKNVEHHYKSCQDIRYLCHPHHRSPSFQGKKSQWKLVRSDECHTFCKAVTLGTSEPSGGLWYISGGGKDILGEAQERMAYFESPPNNQEPWHGYPVGGTRKRAAAHRPPSEVVKRWQESARIPRHVADKIRRGVL